jgi:hypothetical protein
MQYSLYAFIPIAVLLAIALVVAAISFWPSRRREIATISEKPRRSAEIIYFPVRPQPASAAPEPRIYREG